MKSKQWLLFLLTALSFVGFWRVLQFGFFQDDYFFLWNGLYDPFAQFINFKHPGTPLEAFLFVHLLGLNPVLWGLLGIALRVCVAYLTGVFFGRLTNSRLAGFLSAVFFSAAYAGASTVATFNYHLPVLVALCLLLSFISFLKSASGERKYSRQFVFFLGLGIFLDPIRAIPALCVPPLLLVLLPKTTKTASMKSFLIKFYRVFLAVGVPVFAAWFLWFSVGKDAQVVQMLRAMYTKPGNIPVEGKVIGNYFASITNLFTDVVFRLRSDVPKYETADYRRTLGVVGVGIAIISLLLYLRFRRTKIRKFGILSFCLFWALLFFLPNWAAETHIPMTSQHHYQLISAIGSVCLVAYLISRIKQKPLLVLVSIGFVMLNTYKTNILFLLQLPYRSSKVIDNAIRVITATAQTPKDNVVFLFTGDTSWFVNSISWDLGLHYLLRNHDSDRSHEPQVTIDEAFVINKLCSPTTRVDFLYRTIRYPQLPISHVYVWNVIAPGALADITPHMRQKLQRMAIEKGCTTLP